MNPWLFVVDTLRAGIFSAAHLFGGSLGAGVIAVSVAARVALLALTLPLARRMLEQQRKLRALAPELARLQKRYARDRAKLGEATLTLYREHNGEVVPRGTFKP